MSKKIFAVALIMSGVLLAGCSSTKGSYSGKIEDDVPVEEVGASGDTVASGSITPGFEPLKEAIDDERQADSLLKTRLIFFDYDKSVVREEFLPVLSAHAEFLLRYADKGVVLSGHADERGSNEYNLALGQRRADAVRGLLSAAGVPAAQVESISFGEEQPRVQGSNENAWRENRRVQIRYTDE